jgi:NAD(P)-dependent dehydrogenase (short-subunit alcohol dehydrogenase family)
VEETPDNELRAEMETNFFGAVAVTKALIPQLRKQQSGAIVNMSSLGGQLSYPGFGAYSASKFALEGISEALAGELGPLGIKVLIVEPGQFRTDLAGAAMKHMPETDVYKDTAGKIREFARSMGGTQEGDPLKAAAAIDKALKAEKTPLRLQLGKDAVDAIRQHSETLLDDLRHWEAVAVDTRL